MSFSKRVTIYSNDIVGWRSGDPIWTVSGEVPLLSIGCPGVCPQVFAHPDGKTFPVARFHRAPDPANTAFRLYLSQ